MHLKDNYRSTPQVLRGAEGVLNNILSTGVTPERVVLNPLQSEGPQIQVCPFKCCTEACSAVLSLSCMLQVKIDNCASAHMTAFLDTCFAVICVLC